MSKAVTIAATEELFESITTYKGGVAVSIRYMYHTVDDATGAVISARQDVVEVTEAEIAADPILVKVTEDTLADADVKREEKDIADEAAVIEAAEAVEDLEPK